MKNDKTIYDNEDTTLDETRLASDETEETTESAEGKKKGSAWRKAATGMGTGILLGSIASFVVTSTANAANPDNGNEEEANHEAEHQNPEWADDSVAIATAVSDDMTFSQAFAAARAEVGPGGAFEWHGNVYGTYTAEEWDNMSSEERDEYSNHFSWNHHSTVAVSDIVDVQSEEQQTEEQQVEEHAEESVVEQHTEEQTEEVEIVSVDQGDDSHPAIEDVVMSADELIPEVEILGVAHDEESGANIGGMMVDGQEVYLIDVDGGGTFDYVAADLNNDGKITENEYVDISAEHITVSQLDHSFDGDTLYASNEGETDYINDDVIA